MTMHETDRYSKSIEESVKRLSELSRKMVEEKKKLNGLVNDQARVDAIAAYESVAAEPLEGEICPQMVKKAQGSLWERVQKDLGWAFESVLFMYGKRD